MKEQYLLYCILQNLLTQQIALELLLSITAFNVSFENSYCGQISKNGMLLSQTKIILALLSSSGIK